ncbi:SPRY domain-containing SOCS box protein 4, partial [Homalodisca vitripennis]
MRGIQSRYDIVLKDLDEEEKPHVHYSWTILDAVLHLSRPPTDLRFPRATATEDFEEARLLTEGLYVWEMDWPSENRGSHAVVGVATRGGLMYPMKRKENVSINFYIHRPTAKTPNIVRGGGPSHQFVDGVVHNGEGDRCYPLQQTEERYTVPDKFHVVLDMTDGTLSFIVNGKWLGTALSGMAGHCLYPIVNSRQ